MEVQNEEPSGRWKFVIVVAKFVMNFLEISISKSFGVLIPEMVRVFYTSYSVIGLICSLPITLMFATCPLVAIFLKTTKGKLRVTAMVGGCISSFTIVACGFTQNLVYLGTSLSFNGLGLAMGYMPCIILLNEYFPVRFVMVNTICTFGSTLGAFVVPVIVERALSAYGYHGAMVILGGICLHSLAASATLRPKLQRTKSDAVCKDGEEKEDSEEEKEKEDNTEEKEEKMPILNVSQIVEEEPERNILSEQEMEPNTCWTCLCNWIRNCIFIKEPLFTLVLPVQFFIQFCAYSWMLFLVPRAEWLGIPPLEAALLSTIGGAGGLIGRICLILLLHLRFDPIIQCCIGAAMCGTVFLFDPLVHSYMTLCVTAFIQGWGVFTCSALLTAFAKVTVSDENFTIACGVSGLVVGLGAIAGGLISGLIFDVTESYTDVFLVVGGIYCFIVINILIYLFVNHRRNSRLL